MGNLPPKTFRDILAMPEVALKPRVFVELGTFKGDSAALATQSFEVVHTIERSAVYYQEAKHKWHHLGIRFHLGDTRIVLPLLSETIREPIFAYHDANWWTVGKDGRGAGYPYVQKDFPLWDDLQTLAKRDYRDIICVDNVHRFGDTKPMQEWADVSLDRIAALFPSHRAAKIFQDQAVVIR